MLQNNLNKLLGERNVKISAVAEATGLAHTTLFSLIKESTAGIQFETIEKLCSYFQITPSELFDYSPYNLEPTLEKQLFELNENSVEFTLNIKDGIYDKDFKLLAQFQLPQNNPYFPKSNKKDYELYVTVSLLDNADYLKVDLFKIIDTLGTNLKRKFYQIMLSKLINSLNSSIKAKRSILAYDLQSKEDVEILLTKKKHCIFEVFKDTDHYKLADLELGTENLLI